MKLSRHTRLTLELIGIAALAVGMGVGFGKLRQPNASTVPTAAPALAIEAPLARVIAPAQPPAPLAAQQEIPAKQEALPIPELKQSEPVQPELAEPGSRAAESSSSVVPRAAAARARRAPRPRKQQPFRAEPSRAEAAAPQPASAEARALEPRAPNAWDMDAYGGRR